MRRAQMLILVAIVLWPVKPVARMSTATAGAAHAAYAGAIAITDWQFPDSTPLGGAFAPTIVNGEISGALLDPLWAPDPKLAFFPDLATVVPSQANGGITVQHGNEVVTIHRKPDQRWSDGSPITDADYIIGLLFDFAPEFNNTFGMDQIATVSFAGDEMTITYKRIYAKALSYATPMPYPLEYFEKKYRVAVPGSLTASYDAGRVAAYFRSPAYQGSPLQQMVNAWLADPYNSPSDVFNGPYKIADWTANQRITLVPNPYYTALPPDPHHPRPAKIVFVALTGNAGTLLLDLAARATYNTIDKAEGFQLPDLPALRRTRYHILTQNAPAYTDLVLNQANPALRDMRVRQALLFAIDKLAYLKAEFPDESGDFIRRIALTSPIPAASPWSNNGALPQNLYDPTKARMLLADAGYATQLGGGGRHLVLDLYSFPAPAQVRSADLLQYFWGKVGVSVRLYFPPAGGANGLFGSYSDGGILAHRRFVIAQIGGSFPPDPDINLLFLDPAQIPDATHPQGANIAGIRDQHLVDLLRRGRQARTDAERRAIYDQFQRYFVQQAYWIMLYSEQNIVAVKDTIGNFQLNPQGNEWNTWQWWDRKAAA